MDKDLYFFYNPINNIIKIGRSNNSEQRLKSIRYMSGIKEIHCLLNYKYRGGIEPKLHRLFKPYKVIGEWFRFNFVMKSYIEYLLKYKVEIEYNDLAFIAITNDFGIYSDTCNNLSFKKLKKELYPLYKNVEEIYDKLLDITKDEQKFGGNLWEFILKKQVTIFTIKNNENAKMFDYFLDYEREKYSLLTHYF